MSRSRRKRDNPVLQKFYVTELPRFNLKRWALAQSTGNRSGACCLHPSIKKIQREWNKIISLGRWIFFFIMAYFMPALPYVIHISFCDDAHPLIMCPVILWPTLIVSMVQVRIFSSILMIDIIFLKPNLFRYSL